MIRRAFSALRLARRAGRSLAMRTYVRLAYPGVRLARGVTFGPGARLRAFDGGVITIGSGAHIGDHALVEAHGGRLTLGEHVLVGRGAVIVCREAITIGAGTLIAEHVTIRDQDHIHAGDAPLAAQGFLADPVQIGAHVWLAAKVTVTRGACIADHAVIGANAVVRGELAERGTYAGLPARRIS